MLKLLGLSRTEEPTLPDDQLSPTSALKRGRAVLQAQAGIPTTADGLAYDPVQRLLAVSADQARLHVVWQVQQLQYLTPTVMHPAGQYPGWPHQGAGPGGRGGVASQCPAGPSTNQAAAVCPKQRWHCALGSGVCDSSVQMPFEMSLCMLGHRPVCADSAHQAALEC